MNKNIKELVIDWLESEQAQGTFDDFSEEFVEFRQCTDDEIEWYYVEWYLNDNKLDELELLSKDDEFSQQMLDERERILNKDRTMTQEAILSDKFVALIDNNREQLARDMERLERNEMTLEELTQRKNEREEQINKLFEPTS